MNGCQWLQQTMQIHFDCVYDKLSLTNPNYKWTPTQNNIPRVVLVITRTKSTTPSPIITWDDVASSTNNLHVHHINHMTHALPFGIPCSETMSVHARLVKINLSFHMCKSGLHPLYAHVESITPDHHEMLQNDES